ncbi:MAG: 4'-phosphopantetheinyl transferase superfamily protein [Bacteroidota bacterium]
MPIVEIKKISISRSLVIWNIAESVEQLKCMIVLSPTETITLESIRSEVKKKEWLAGRIAAKELLISKGINFNGLLNNEYGKPILKEGTGEVSLSHSYPYVVAIHDDAEEVGIDLEQPTPKLKAISRKFLRDVELKSANNNITKLCVYWSAKEALYKIHSQRGLIFKENLWVEPFELHSEGTICGRITVNKVEKKYKLHYSVNQDYVLVYNL